MVPKHTSIIVRHCLFVGGIAGSTQEELSPSRAAFVVGLDADDDGGQGQGQVEDKMPASELKDALDTLAD